MNTEKPSNEEQSQPSILDDASGSLYFTDNELLEMKGSLRSSSLWQKAFNFYNADKNNRKLSMECRPCYIKVMAYLLKTR